MRDLALTNAVKLILRSDKLILRYVKEYGQTADFTMHEIIRNNAFYEVLIALGYTNSEIAIAKAILMQNYSD